MKYNNGLELKRAHSERASKDTLTYTFKEEEILGEVDQLGLGTTASSKYWMEKITTNTVKTD